MRTRKGGGAPEWGIVYFVYFVDRRAGRVGLGGGLAPAVRQPQQLLAVANPTGCCYPADQAAATEGPIPHL